MDLWGALLAAMRTWRTRQISRRTVDRLIAGGSPGLDEHRGLGALLDAAKAPATSGELAGEQAAVEGFAAARRATQPARLRGNNRAGVPLPVRTVAMKVAAAIAVLTVGGTALAARTGHLPASAQRQAHAIFASLGVPAPTPEPVTTPLPTSAPHPSTTRPAPRPSATPSPTAPTTATAVPALIDLCRQWQDKTLTGTDRKTLRLAAGGEKKIDAYCATLLTAAASPSPAPSGNPAESPKPGRGPGSSRPAKPGPENTHRP